jgi:hypothetical protein
VRDPENGIFHNAIFVVTGLRYQDEADRIAEIVKDCRG